MIEAEKIELLILRQFNGEISKAEQLLLTAWVNKSEKNNAFYNKHVELLKAQSLIFTPDAIAQSREKTKTGVINHLIHKSNKVKGFIYSSLSMLLVALIGSSLFFNSSIQHKNQLLAGAFKIAAPLGSPANFQLPDGTNVWLNSASELSYHYDVASNSRLASVEGEAFFAVAHNDQQAFMVQGYKHVVEVFGTEFNVLSDSKKKICEVTLKDGSVGILDNSKKEIARLKPGQQFALDSYGKITVNTVGSVNSVVDWTTGRYEFKDATLEDIAAKLSELYDIAIVIEGEELQHKRFRCVIHKEQSVLKTLQRFSITTNLNYEVSDEIITLKSK